MIDNISKEQFLAEHNRLSPAHLQATFTLLTKFQEEKKPQLKDSGWSYKLRIPFISWLITIPTEKIKHTKLSTKQEYRNYPETKY